MENASPANTPSVLRSFSWMAILVFSGFSSVIAVIALLGLAILGTEEFGLKGWRTVEIIEFALYLAGLPILVTALLTRKRFYNLAIWLRTTVAVVVSALPLAGVGLEIRNLLQLQVPPLVTIDFSKDLTIAPADELSGWLSVNSDAGGFTVEMPVAPEGKSGIVDTAIGALSNHMVIAAPTGTTAFGVVFFDLPILDSVQKQRIYQSSWKSIIGDGELIEKRILQFRGIPATELVVEKLAGQAVVMIRIMLVDSRMYSLSVVMPKKRVSQEAMDRFFESFKWDTNQ